MEYNVRGAAGSKKHQGGGNKRYQPSLDRKKGGSQTEYADEEPIMRKWFYKTSTKRGLQRQISKHYEKIS